MAPDELDTQIKDLLRRGDPTALELIWDRYSEDLLAFTVSMLCSRHDGEDALQETFVKIARNRRSVAKARNLKAYLVRMARNEAINVMNRRKRNVSLDVEEEDWLLPAEDGDQALTHDLARALASLPEDQRIAVVMKVYQGMTFQEMGNALGIPQFTAASRYRYGIQRLRDWYEEDTT